jgi:hypothetical protein
MHGSMCVLPLKSAHAAGMLFLCAVGLMVGRKSRGVCKTDYKCTNCINRAKVAQ